MRTSPPPGTRRGQQYTPGDTSLADLPDTGGMDRIVVHQATGMIAAQTNETAANALARLKVSLVNLMTMDFGDGPNDDNEFFSTANAATLESFAAANGVAELSFWEVDGYDKPAGYQYSSIFGKITGGSPGGGGTSGAAGAVTGYQGLCLDDRSASTANFNPVQVYTGNGTSAQQWTAGSGDALQVLGKCLDDTGYGGSGTQVQLWSCAGTASQQWKLP